MVATALFGLLLLLLAPPCEATVLGIDFGSEFYKISLIKPGKAFEMVENLNSKTNTYNVLTFFDNRRLKEYEGYTRVLRVPHNAFFMFNKYIGKPLDDPVLSRLRSIHYDDYKLVDLDSGRIAFEVKDFKLPSNVDGTNIERLDGKTQLTLEEIVGMVLDHARLLSTAFAQTEVKDAFFSVPPWWGPGERKTLYSIAKLAGLNPQGFVSENTGTATYHAINRKKESANETILFFNMGSQSTKTSIFTFENVVDAKNNTKETYKLLSEAWDEEAGGYNLDSCIARHFAAEFDKKFGFETITTNVRIMRRLIREANKVKEILSANKEASFIVEEVFNDKDFSRKYTREEFEAICREPIERSVDTIRVALERAGITADKLDAIQIVGGSVRIPLIHALIKEKFSKEHSMNFNGDNSMAMGISFLAANASNNFRTKTMYLTHGPSYATNVVVTELGTDVVVNETQVFPHFREYNGKHLMLLNVTSKDLDIKITAVPIEQGHNREPFAISYNVTGIEAFLSNETLKDAYNTTLRLGFVVDLFGLPGLGLADIIYVQDIEEKLPKTKKSKSENATDEENKSEEPETKKVPRVFNSQLNITLKGDNQPCLIEHQERFVESRSVLRRFQKYEELINKNKEEKNKLESFIFQARELKSNDVLLPYAKESEIEELAKSAEEFDEWLYSDEARDANYTVFQNKSSIFEKTLSNIRNRKDEHAKRDLAVSAAFEKIENILKQINEMNKTRPWVPEKERNTSIDTVNGIKDWIEKSVEEQAKLSLNEDPAIRLRDIKKKLDVAQEEIYRLRAILKEEDKNSKKYSGKSKGGSGAGDFKIKPKDLLGALKLDPEGFAKVAAQFDLDDDNVKFGDILAFLKENNIKSSLDKDEKTFTPPEEEPQSANETSSQDDSSSQTEDQTGEAPGSEQPADSTTETPIDL